MIEKIHRGDAEARRGSFAALCLRVCVVGFLLSGCSALLPPRNEVDAPRAAPAALAANPAPAPADAAPAGWSEYRAQPGDTIYALARRHGVKPAQIAGANNLPANAPLRVGQALRVPGEAPAVAARDSAPAPLAAPRIAVAKADLTPSTPAARTQPQSAAPPAAQAEPAPAPAGAHGRLLPAPRRAPLEAPLQGAAAPGPVADDTVELSAGPGLDSEPPPMAQQVAAVPDAPPPAPAKPAAAPAAAPAAKPPVQVPAPPARAASGFMRPVDGRTLVSYGTQPGGLRNDGINIAAQRGTPVKAADNGVVVYAGNELRGFGNLLLISHAGGWMTAYAHLDAMNVARGDRIARGQRIGTVGMTGNVTSPQLHFEIRKGKQPVDPEQQLAAGAPQAAMRPPPVGAAR